MTPLERFLGYVQTGEGCWNWTGYAQQTDVGMRGRFGYEGRNQWAPRVAYQLFVGPIPRGLFACHKCDNSLCVKPSHLFLGTAADNNWDKSRKGRAYRASLVVTHCKRGHEFTPGNTKTFRLRTGYTSRQCRICLKANWTKHNAAQKRGG